MKIIGEVNDISFRADGPVCCAFGYFDGMHLGHQRVLKEALSSGMKSAVMTFINRPMNYITGSGYTASQLMSADERVGHLERMGFDYLFLFEFNDRIMNTTKEDFVRDYIHRLGIVKAVCGTDYTFGKGREGNTKNLPELCAPYGIETDIVDDVYFLGELISSTGIRECLRSGDITGARQRLGRFYSVSGTVSRGRHIGHSLGYATANIVPSPELVLPKNGVYLTRCTADGRSYLSVSNVGVNPTVSDEGKICLESHLFGTDEEMYGKKLRVEFLMRLRDEHRFSGTAELSEQIGRDIDIVKDLYEIQDIYTGMQGKQL